MLKLPLPKLRSTTRVHPNVTYFTFLFVGLIMVGCSAGVQSTQTSHNHLPPQCDPQKIIFYQKNSSHLSEYVDDFIGEISKISKLKGNFQLEIRRSQVMIAFGEDLIKRLGLLESSLDCAPLRDQYLVDRQMIFNKLEGLIQSQSSP